MARFLGIGNGSDGIIALGSYTPLKYTCSGTDEATTLTATGTFAAGDRLFIIQSRGTGVGAYEDNRVDSYVAGTITLVHPLENTYTDSGASQAQVLVVKEASEVTGSITAPAWGGDVGGGLVVACSGVFSGTISANARGYRGGPGYNLDAGTGTGEGTVGASTGTGDPSNPTRAANGNGGGSTNGGSGGAGGHATVGADGNNAVKTGGDGGLQVGQAAITSMFMGGAAAGSVGAESPTGGKGGGFVVVYANNITSSASLTADGADGADHTIANGSGASGGAGGSILVKAKTVDASGTITADKGTGGTGSGTGVAGVDGSDGRIRIESCSVSGTTSPTASESTGGHDYCGGSAFLI